MIGPLMKMASLAVSGLITIISHVIIKNNEHALAEEEHVILNQQRTLRDIQDTLTRWNRELANTQFAIENLKNKLFTEYGLSDTKACQIYMARVFLDLHENFLRALECPISKQMMAQPTRVGDQVYDKQSVDTLYDLEEQRGMLPADPLTRRPWPPRNQAKPDENLEFLIAFLEVLGIKPQIKEMINQGRYTFSQTEMDAIEQNMTHMKMDMPRQVKEEVEQFNRLNALNQKGYAVLRDATQGHQEPNQNAPEIQGNRTIPKL